MSLTGLLILAQQFVIGWRWASRCRIVFASSGNGRRNYWNDDGLSFATFFDPQSQGPVKCN